MHNIRLQIAYDGTKFLGWQKTKMGRSIEESLEQSIRQILQEDVVLQAASRTDAGVHAVGQVVNFRTKRDLLSLQSFMISLNYLLPEGIAAMKIDYADSGFHPTLDCLGKEYHYNLCYGIAQLPHHRLYSWHYPKRLDLAAMQGAANQLVGLHDFSSFRNFRQNEDQGCSIRHIEEISVDGISNERVLFRIRGDNFLYKMVRNLVGTLVYIGCGKIDQNAISTILASRKRENAGMTAPAHGLYLYGVYYC